VVVGARSRAGTATYLDDGLDPSDLSSRTSFWFVDLSGFGERKLTGRSGCSASGGIRSEFHRLEVDDVTSVGPRWLGRSDRALTIVVD
jgi:hypothetical protein